MGDVLDVMRIAKIKDWGSIGGADAHNSRSRPCPNADAAQSAALNRRLIGDSESSLVDVVRQRIGDQKIRKNAVLAVEMLLSASPAYFRPSHPEKAGTFDQGRLDAWVAAKLHWLSRKYGDRVVRADLHLDESTPHIHIVIVPVDDNGKLNCRAFFGGSRAILSALQDESAASVSALGICRGARDAKAEHVVIGNFYQAVNTPAEPLPVISTPEPAPLDKPGVLASKAKKEEWEDNQRQREQHRQEFEKRAAAAVRLAEQYQSQAAAAQVLRRQVRELKRQNSHLSGALAALKKYVDGLRSMPLAELAQAVFGAVTGKPSKPQAEPTPRRDEPKTPPAPRRQPVDKSGAAVAGGAVAALKAGRGKASNLPAPSPKPA